MQNGSPGQADGILLRLPGAVFAARYFVAEYKITFAPLLYERQRGEVFLLYAYRDLPFRVKNETEQRFAVGAAETARRSDGRRKDGEWCLFSAVTAAGQRARGFFERKGGHRRRKRGLFCSGRCRSERCEKSLFTVIAAAVI